MSKKSRPNDPCPCKNGKKYKRCHGAKGVPTLHEKFPTWVHYWQDSKAKIEKAVSDQANPVVEAHIEGALGILTYEMEEPQLRITRFREAANYLDPALLQLFDAMRGLHAAMKTLSVTSCANLARTIFELRANMLYIYRHLEPVKMARRWSEYFDVEFCQFKLKQTADLAERARLIADLKAIRPEWIRTNKKTGADYIGLRHWSAEVPNFQTVCERVGLESIYDSFYSTASKAVHGLTTARGLYKGKDGLQAIPPLKHCAGMALQGVMHALAFAEEFCTFTRIPYDRGSIRGWRLRTQAMCREAGFEDVEVPLLEPILYLTGKTTRPPPAPWPPRS